MNKKAFLKRISDNYKIFEKWPKWMQLITISSSTASSGKFIDIKNKEE